MDSILHLLCAGAAQGVVKALQATLKAQTGAAIDARFGAVGAMREAFDAGSPCDVLVLTDAMVGTMVDAGALRGDTRAPLGRVRTGVAVRHGDLHPDVSRPDALRAALLAADAIYFPDPQRATAGIHFASVLRQLGVHDELAPRFRNYPNGAISMRELAAAPTPRPIGCTQVTEIKYTEGVDLVGLLPARFELATLYTVAVTQRCTHPELARRFIELIAGAGSAALRQQAGFEA